jgi:hypothetical protein
MTDYQIVPMGDSIKGRPSLDSLRTNKVPFTGKIGETDEQIYNRINKTFNIHQRLIVKFVEGLGNGFITSGHTGTGKTFLAEQELVYAASKGKIRFHTHAGVISAVNFYILLFENKERDQVLLLDDSDQWKNREFVNTLKAALDSKKERWVHWDKNSPPLMGKGIPTEFLYEGRLLVNTNENLQKYVEKGGDMAEHMKALLGRVKYFDLGVHTLREVYQRMLHLVNTSSFLQDHGFTVRQGELMMKWIRANIGSIRALSMRTLIDLGPLIREDDDWEDIAAELLFRK